MANRRILLGFEEGVEEGFEDFSFLILPESFDNPLLSKCIRSYDGKD